MQSYSGQMLGNYEVRDCIGKGGMAEVYLGYQPSMDRPVAIKIMIPELAASEKYVRRFQQETHTIATLEHPNIVPVYDAGKQDTVLFLVMRYLAGGALADCLPDDGLALESALQIFEQIALALDYAHGKGVIHCDLKPGNILIDESGNALLSDFGLARALDADERLSMSGGIIGTPAFMSPEQVLGQESDPRSDIYSLGVLLFTVLAGQVPYDSSTPFSVLYMHVRDPVPDISTVQPDLPPAVSLVIQRAMAKEPAHRYATAREFLQAFQNAARGGGITHRGKPTVEFVQPDQPRGPFFYPNAWALCLLQAAEESLGRMDYEAVLQIAGLVGYLDCPPPDNMKKEFPFVHVRAFFQKVYELYGGRGARSLGRFAGERSFELGARKFEGIIRLSRAAIMRAAGESVRLGIAMRFYQGYSMMVSDELVELDEDEHHLYWTLTRCPFCWGWHNAPEPVCHPVTGNLDATVEWAVGKRLRLTEVECQAMGHANCVFAVDKKELG